MSIQELVNILRLVGYKDKIAIWDSIRSDLVCKFNIEKEVPIKLRNLEINCVEAYDNEIVIEVKV